MINRFARRASDVLFRWAFIFFEKLGIHVLPVHFYSPIPDTQKLRKRLKLWYKEQPMTGVDFNVQGQHEFLNLLSSYKAELSVLPTYQEIHDKGYGEGYGAIEAFLLYLMVRHLKPRTIIEIGSGVSTFFSHLAITQNQTGKTICIEPYPTQPLKGFCEKNTIELISKPLEELPIDFFSILEKNDILFIDSSHVLKVDNDVYNIYLNVLPNLKPGVVVHIHDIPFPYPTSNPYYWIFKRHFFWNEAALLQAFLTFNNAFKILVCGSYLHYKTPEQLQNLFATYNPQKHFPSAIWIQKVA